MPLSHVEDEYDSIQSTYPSLDDQHRLASTNYTLPSWLYSLSSTFDNILHIFPLNEYIMEILSIKEAPWDDKHHRSSFLPNLDDIEKGISCIFSSDIVESPQYPIPTQDTISEGNLGNISSTIIVELSIKEGIVEKIQLGTNCSTEEVETYTTLFK
jgi:hypothetical protein